MRGFTVERARIELRSRPQLAGACALVAGLLACRLSAPALIVLTTVCAGMGAAGGGRALALLLAGCLAAGAALGALRLAALDSPLERLEPGDTLSALVELESGARHSAFGWSATGRLLTGPARGAHVLVRGTRGASIDARFDERGDRARVSGLVEPLPRGRGGDDGYARHLRATGVGAQLELESAEPAGRAGGLTGAIGSLRRRGERALARGLPPERAALAGGMVLGEDERIDATTVDDFRRSGLSHLLAVSGQNVVLLGALALPLLAAAGLGLRGRAAALLGLIAVYVPLAGAGPPLQRAGVMGAAGLVALLAGRAASRWYALALAAAVTLALNPRVAGEAGWQLSFAAVAGMLALTPRLARSLRRLPRPLADAFAVTLAASLATAPLLAHHFGTLPAWSLAANLLALPAVAPAMWLGMAQIALAAVAPPAGPAATAAAWAETLLGRLASLPLAWLAGVARWFAGAPGAKPAIALPSPASVLAAYVALAAALLALARAWHRLEPWAQSLAGEWRRVPRRERRAALALACVAALAAGRQASGPGAAPRALTVSFLDVGQGDATLIQDPGGAAVLFDGGPPEARVALKLRRLGVRRLDLVVSTHQSRDHQGGLHEVLARIPTRLLLENGYGTRDPDYHLLLAEAAAQGIRRLSARAGQVFHVGGLTIRILGPPPRAPGEPAPAEPNPIGVAAIVSERGFDLWLSADAESGAILRYPLRPVEAMKVSHHGSRDPGLPQVLRRLRPQVAAIEVGAHNSYGHPTPETLAALRRAVPHVYRTDRDGTVRLTVERDTMSVATAR